MCRTNLKKINSQQKHTSILFKYTKILNIYRLHIFNTAVFMHKIQRNSAPSILLSKFRKPSLSHPTRFSHLNYVKPIPKVDKCNYRISYRGPFIWNNFLSTTDKQITDVAKFKAVNQVKTTFTKRNKLFLISDICTFIHIYSVRQLN